MRRSACLGRSRPCVSLVLGVLLAAVLLSGCTPAGVQPLFETSAPAPSVQASSPATATATAGATAPATAPAAAGAAPSPTPRRAKPVLGPPVLGPPTRPPAPQPVPGPSPKGVSKPPTTHTYLPNVGAASPSDVGSPVPGPPAPVPDALRGAPSFGDSLFPTLGNGGIDVQSYALDLVLDVPERPTLVATATLAVRARQDLGSFSLDFMGYPVAGLALDGGNASFAQAGTKLVITPTIPLAQGAEFQLAISYRGPLKTYDGPPGTGQFGWLPSPTGGIFRSEPNYAHGWFPCNDHPRDRATFRFRVTVPRGLNVAANGVQGAVVDGGGRVTYEFAVRDPMAPYQAVVAVSKFRVLRRSGPGGLPIVDYVAPGASQAALDAFAREGQAITQLGAWLGPYPFEAYGAIVTDAPAFTGGFEAPTRPVYSIRMTGNLIEHETAHQWIGDLVTLDDWRETWIKEGLATYLGQLMRAELAGGGVQATDDAVRRAYHSLLAYLAGGPLDGLSAQAAGPLTGRLPVTVPGKVRTHAEAYGLGPYQIAAFMFHDLRLRLGDDAFRRFLREYVSRYRFSYAGDVDVIVLANEVAGQELSPFFAAWLNTEPVNDLPALGLRPSLR